MANQIPPQDIEAEQAVLGAIFLDADSIIDAMEIIEPQDFYRRKPSDYLSSDDSTQ